jgi:hypothetical protein
MLDFADLVAINKFDKRGSLDALRDVRKQYRRNHNLFDGKDEELPVYGTDGLAVQRPGHERALPRLIAAILKNPGRSRSSLGADRKAMSENARDPARARALPRRDRREQPIATTAFAGEQSASRAALPAHGAEAPLPARRAGASPSAVPTTSCQLAGRRRRAGDLKRSRASSPLRERSTPSRGALRAWPDPGREAR